MPPTSSNSWRSNLLVLTVTVVSMVLMRTRMTTAAHAASQIVESGKLFLVYGTAWKKEHTAHLVDMAVKSGFRFIDTACQPRHYNEPGVGEGWSGAASHLGLQRSDFFLQTKYTPFGGQDPDNCPYDPQSPIEDQVRISLETSLRNLKTDYLDSWVMHSPFQEFEDTMKAWRTMETYVDAGKVKGLGMSNCYDPELFATLYDMAKHKPKVLQNRFYAASNFDTELRRFCKEKGIWYQSFWTLTANRDALATTEVHELATSKNLNPQTLLFAFLLSLGYVTPLSGTTSATHMQHDVEVMERFQSGEVFFENEDELRVMARYLGMPDL
ncbi:keto reductase family 1 member C1 homolog [Seminavis robusta]|uniref:Keto reductase family 1 member C1 homolog n=1 Tax=Seminavis robusta TaxID=568900 RepID=A0A9N8H667_9STRA|nr:keto reductase family 1 member C1 homolog [Seminavis robusta]|eukprot:Sro162_g072970.1 keto reductase family 1 member C1 homolog (326) ;mRNA; r:87488-88817